MIKKMLRDDLASCEKAIERARAVGDDHMVKEHTKRRDHIAARLAARADEPEATTNGRRLPAGWGLGQ